MNGEPQMGQTRAVDFTCCRLQTVVVQIAQSARETTVIRAQLKLFSADVSKSGHESKLGLPFAHEKRGLDTMIIFDVVGKTAPLLVAYVVKPQRGLDSACQSFL